MILVKHGCFMMGATEEQKEPNNDEKPVHKVIITKTTISVKLKSLKGYGTLSWETIPHILREITDQ